MSFEMLLMHKTIQMSINSYRNCKKKRFNLRLTRQLCELVITVERTNNASHIAYLNDVSQTSTKAHVAQLAIVITMSTISLRRKNVFYATRIIKLRTANYCES